MNPKHKRLLIAGSVSAIALWGPWVWAFLTVENAGLDGSLLYSIAIHLSLPTLGPAWSAIFSGSDVPHWLAEILSVLISDTLNGTFHVQFFFWIFFTLCLLGAMAVLGSRGKWWLVSAALVAFSFEALSVHSMLNL